MLLIIGNNEWQAAQRKLIETEKPDLTNGKPASHRKTSPDEFKRKFKTAQDYFASIGQEMPGG
jgi:hypothetical protein